MEQIPINLTSKLSYIKLNPCWKKKSSSHIHPSLQSSSHAKIDLNTPPLSTKPLLFLHSKMYIKKRVQEGNPKEQ